MGEVGKTIYKKPLFMGPGIEHIFVYPRGWMMVATSEEVTQEPLQRDLLGRRLAMYRGAQGQAVVMDAFCPHMGASLAAGGTVEGDNIICPFHGWQFAPNGKCVHIPYTQTIPKRAEVRAFQTQEVNGMVFIWHDEEQGEPHYNVPDQPEYQDPTWETWTMKHLVFRIPPREVVDNIADKMHFPVVHGSGVTRFDVTFDAHSSTQSQDGYVLGDNTPDRLSAFTSDATYHGPGYLITVMKNKFFESKFLVCLTPIDEDSTSMWAGHMVKVIVDGPQEEKDAMRDIYKKNIMDGFLEDGHIWENKTLVHRPLVCEGDGPILQARKWYSQFYRPRAEQAPPPPATTIHA